MGKVTGKGEIVIDFTLSQGHAGYNVFHKLGVLCLYFSIALLRKSYGEIKVGLRHLYMCTQVLGLINLNLYSYFQESIALFKSCAPCCA